ncbi:MAG: nucleotidyltransferase family protein, partial [Candidatus Binatia bacterium]
MDKLPFLKIALVGPLSTVLPSTEQTQLLRACLWSRESSAEAWREWSREIADPAAFLREDTDGVKGLLPLLFHSLQDKDVVIDKEFHTYLRTAYLRDELRSKAYSQICRDVTSLFENAGIPAVVLKGAALAETAYPKPVLQHSHYLDVLVHDDDLSRAVDLLPSLEFTRSSEPNGYAWNRCEFVHESGLPLVLYRRLFGVPFFEIPMEDFWARSRMHKICGVPTRLLSPADNLFHICSSVFDAASHDSLRWVCDAWFIIRQYPNLDWDLLLNCARRS